MLYSRIETPDDLRNAMTAAQLTRVLQVAHHIGVFEALAGGPRPLAEIAKATVADPGHVERLLTACCAMGLLSRDGDSFANGPLAAEYLVSDRPFYQGSMLNHSMEVWKRWNDLPLRFRPDQGDRPWGTWDDFILAMHNITVTERGEELARDVSLAGRKRLVDVGGGPGTYSIFLCKANPELRATIWDLPQTIAVTRRVVARYEEVRDRIDFAEGDWDHDPFGEGYDALLMSNVLHGNTSDPAPKLAKAFQALVPGGMIVVQDSILNNERESPLSAAMFNLYIGAFTFSEIGELLRQAGFADVQTVRAPRVDGLGVATACRP